MKRRLARPFLSFAFLGLVLVIVVWATGARHDSGGLLSALYYAGALFALPFWLVQQLLQPLARGEATTPVVVSSVCGGLLLCWLADKALDRLRRRGRERGPAA